MILVCEHCNAKMDNEEAALVKKHGVMICPKCERAGCAECMPSGRGCICPECEDGGDEE